MSMGKGGGGGGQQPHSTEGTVVAVVVVVAIAAYVIWTLGRMPIVYGIYALDWPQYWALSKFGMLKGDSLSWYNYLTGVLDGRWNADPANRGWLERVEFSDLVAMQTDLGSYMKYPMCAMIFGLAVLCIFKMRGDGYRRTYSLTGQAKESVMHFLGFGIRNGILKFFFGILGKVPFLGKVLVKNKRLWVQKGVSFAHFQASHWRVALAGAHFDPNKDDKAQAPAQTPFEWLKDQKIRLSKREGLDEEAAKLSFERQLGPTWQGIEHAPAYIQGICVMAALNLKKDKDGCKNLRDRMTEFYVLNPAKADALTREIIAPYLANPGIKAAIDRRGARHGFTNSAVIGIYGWGGPMKEWGGGKSGVLSSSMFRWLKRVDRTLWFCLNNVGRRAFHIEGAGAVAHFQAERVVSIPLGDPNVDDAVEGLANYIEDSGVMDLDEFFHQEKEFE